VRGSQEKVGLAQAAYDSVSRQFCFFFSASPSPLMRHEQTWYLSAFISRKVDRHIRLLDQSIREQEMSISFGLRQGTHPSLLPDLAAPSRWARATRVAQSPIPSLSDDEDIAEAPPVISAGSEVTIGMATGSTDAPPRASFFKKSKKAKKRRTSDKVVSEAEAVAAPAVGASTAASSSRSLKLKVPPLNAIMQGDAAADPNEPKYCFCNRVSFGNVRHRLSYVFKLPV